MPYMVENNQKEFERPANGIYVGVAVDVVDLGIVPSKNPAYAAKPKVRIVWAIDAKTSEGKTFYVSSTVNSSTHEKSAMFAIVKSILGQFPAPPFDLETIIGKSNELFVVNEASQDNTKTYANVKVITALSAGKQPLAIPGDYVRDKNKPVADQAATKLAARLAQTRPAAPPAQAPTAPPSPAPAAVAGVPDDEIAF